MTREINLTKITSKFGRAYARADRAAKAKAKEQEAFFTAINKVLETRIRQQKVVDTELRLPDEPLSNFIARVYPGWRFLKESHNMVVIEEDPAFMKFSFVNPEDRQIYARTVSQGSPVLDEKALQANDPELWEAISVWPEPWYTLMSDFAVIWNLNQNNPPASDLRTLLNAFLTESGMSKILKDYEQWTPEELNAAQRYLSPGKIGVRLVAPRLAKEEEL